MSTSQDVYERAWIRAQRDIGRGTDSEVAIERAIRREKRQDRQRVAQSGRKRRAARRQRSYRRASRRR